MSFATSRILILDFGSQFTQLIARRLRELKVYCEIYPCDASFASIQKFNPGGIILSGGPFSVYDKKAPKLAKGKDDIFSLNVPVLGICYGMQYIAKHFGGSVIQAKTREYGRAQIRNAEKSLLMPWLNQTKKLQVWMSHGDEIGELPTGFFLTSESHNGSPASIEFPEKNVYAVQFHPEVNHTEKGREILSTFAFDICRLKPDWNMQTLIDSELKSIREKVGKNHVICGISGGVDSTVAATLVHKAVGKQLTCIFVDNGLLRKNEAEQVMSVYKQTLGLNVVHVDASKLFLKKLKGIVNPERKRKIIGKEFIEVFQKEARKISKNKKNVKYLVQGTLYPDVIESVPPPRVVQGTSGVKGFSSTIKSHHNVGGLPKNLKFELIEPLRELFKDEVRMMGKLLNIPENILNRHPFPGPGLAVRIIGDITKERLEILRNVDSIFIKEIYNAGLYNDIWQAFAVFLPIQSVGVMGDGRTYENAVALRAVTSQDGMTADWYSFKSEFLAHVSNQITGSVRGVNRVVYDISSKPPSTIEWE